MATYYGMVRGCWRVYQAYNTHVRGLWRTAETALARYELHDGEDDSPDLDAAASATSATLPFSHALSAGHTHHLVVRQRNAYGLVSQNVDETVIEIAADGSQVATRPSAPYDVEADAAAGGTVRVRARYNYLADAGHEGTTWAIWQTDDGSEPDPTDPETATVAMVKRDGAARLDWTSGAYGDGLTVKTLVRTRYASGGSDIDSTNTASVSCVANDDGPAAVAGDAFFARAVARQGQ